jgi:Rod binding domain-containing protein
MRTAAQDFHTVMMKAALQDIRDALGRDCDSAVMTDEERAMLDALASPTPPA